MHIGFWWESHKERDHYGNLDVDRWIVLKWMLREIEWGYVDWIDLSKGRH
jgi:hypothetical protein